MKPVTHARLAALVAAHVLVYSGAAQQAPTIDWTYRAGGPLNDNAYSIAATADGGSIVAGQVLPAAEGPLGGDAWVAKLNADGGVEWSETYGGSGYDRARCIIELAEGGYLFVGGTSSDDGNVEGHIGGGDYWVVRLSAGGAIVWQRCFGGSDLDVAQGVVRSRNGGFIITGEARSSDGQVSGNSGATDLWLVKLDEDGTLLWEQALGGSTSDAGFAVIETIDGEIVTAGTTTSNDGIVTGFQGLYDYWVIKLSADGQLIWQKTLGGTDQDIATGLAEDPMDGSLAVIGDSYSSDGHVVAPFGDRDAWVAILSPDGGLLSTRTCGGSSADFARSVLSHAGDWFVAGTTSSVDGDLEASNGGSDIWLFKLNNSGDLVWSNSYGGDAGDGCNAMALAGDGGILVAGGTMSTNLAPPGHGGLDCLVMKLGRDDVGLTEAETPSRFNIFPNPVSSVLMIESTAAIDGLVEVWSTTGQLVRTKRLVGSHVPIDMQGLSTGTYLVRVKDSVTQSVHRVVIKV